MLNWLVRLWSRVTRWAQGEHDSPAPYRRSNLHGRHR
jgi:hypothetical protein